MNNSIIDGICSPEDVKKLDDTQLPVLCAEIREFLLESVSKTGGHLASNLGSVELTVALHRIFQSPHDQIVWDVGHQCYTHKLLTGRKDKFHMLRKEGGISGFPKHAENEHDTFLAGHSSTSVSVACGLAKAKKIQTDDGSVIAVIGDGAFTNGMVYEGLNNISQEDANLIIILNDNQMSISKNVGSFAKYLAVIRSQPQYFRAKDAVESFLTKVPVVGKPIKKGISVAKTVAKNYLYHSNMFEDFGFVFLGPVDGHDVHALCNILQRAKELREPAFILIQTQKGKGYRFSEENPGEYHGVSAFDLATGKGQPKEGSDFSTEFGKYLARLGEKDKRICAITAAMKHGTGLQYFSRKFKKEGRFFDVGIAEGHAVTFAGGLAANGMIPVFAVYSSFLQRSYDQVLHDLSIEKQHVVLAIDRAGIVGDDGETHQGLFDVSILTSIPGMTIYSPANYCQLRYCLHESIYQHSGVVAVRYPRGDQPTLSPQYTQCKGDWFYYDASEENLIISYGRVYEQAVLAAEKLAQEGLTVSLLQMKKIYPIMDEIIKTALPYQNILFVEEGIKNGGIGEHFAVKLMECGFKGTFRILAVEERFVPQATIPAALAKLGLDSDSIAQTFSHLTKMPLGGNDEDSIRCCTL